MTYISRLACIILKYTCLNACTLTQYIEIPVGSTKSILEFMDTMSI